jgi:20S proteasome alpha/beta subunit
MREASILVILVFVIGTQAVCQGKTKEGPGPSFHGTINVVVANDHGIVLLTDSMLTKTWSANGVSLSKQLPTPGQKLFQLDDRTVCTFDGFARAVTPGLPSFLNDTSAIIGRYEDKMKASRPLLVTEKLEGLENVFTHYLTGVANIRNEGRYLFELLIAGYDPDGTPEVGRLVLGTNLEQTAAGSFLKSITLQRSVFPVVHRQVLCLNGIVDVAVEILRGSKVWMDDPGIGGCAQSTSDQEMLSIEQMRVLARSLKQHTTERHKEVGGPTQVAILYKGRVQRVVQPKFDPIRPSGYKFAIVATDSFGNTAPPPGVPIGSVSRLGLLALVQEPLYGLYFSNRFFNGRQELHDAFYGGNVFENCILAYNGGQLQFARSNKVIDSELEIGEAVRNSPVAKKLLQDFHWKTVTYTKADSTKKFPWMTK